MSKITENDIELLAIEDLENLGHHYIYAPDIAPEADLSERNSYSQVILVERLKKAIERINPSIPLQAQEDALKQIERISSDNLATDNEFFHRLLTEGIKISYQKEGSQRGDIIKLIDFDDIEKNEFLVVNQFTIIENNHQKRPDLILFINGLPLVVIELKNAIDENATLLSAYHQLQTYKSTIPSLFTYNSILIISDGLEAKAGSLSAGFSRFMNWKTSDGKKEASRFIPQLETLTNGMLNKTTLLDYIRHFIVFEKSKKEDLKTGIITIQTVKKIAAYHQYYAVNKAVESTMRAANFNPPPAPPKRGVSEMTSAMSNENTIEDSSNSAATDVVVEDNTQKTPLSGRAGGGFKAGSGFRRIIIPYKPYLKDLAKKLRKNMTPSEVLLWKELKGRQMMGFDFDRQRPIDNYIVDFYCKDLMLAIEVDGSVHYTEEAKINDALRQERLESLGVRFLRFDNSEVINNISGVIAIMQEWIEERKDNLVGRIYHNETKKVESTNTSKIGDQKGGVIWHTQGSGKSLSMVFYAGKIVLQLDNPTLLVITDRNDLDDQLFDTFSSATQLLRQTPIQAQDSHHLKELLKVASGGVVFSTIQKFQPEDGNIYETLSERKNIVVIADEAHRTQYGFNAKTIEEKDENGNIIGVKEVYGFAKYLRDALPKATYLGFTGTPIENTDVNTAAVFGNYVDIYDISQAVEDGATVKIYYESRLAKINLTEEGRELIEELDEELAETELTETQKSKAKWTKLEALVGSEKRIENIAKDIVSHFEARQEVFEGKAMIVSMSRRIAAELYKAIINLKPEWHHEDLDKGVIKVIMTSSSSDGAEMAKHHTSKQERKMLADRMKEPTDELKLVIVRDMWLTGFDAPSMHTLYIDKPMKGHNLMQAIARVNRVYKDKPGGLVVDYLGIASDLKKALAFYSDSGGKGDPAIVQEQAVQIMLEKLEIVSQLFSEKPQEKSDSEYTFFSYSDYFTADTRTKLKLLLAAEDHILSLENGQKRFTSEVTALSKAFAIAIPHEKAVEIKNEVGFFQAIKARLQKFETTNSSGKSDHEIESAIRQVIDKALVSDKVIDIFDAAGIKAPTISILSDEFLMEIKDMEYKNVALETLKKLLNDEIKSRATTNLIQSKSLLEMLQNSIKKYQNKVITAAEVIEELITLANSIKNKDKEYADTGMTKEELAFYYAIAENQSANEILGNDVLRQLAVYLSEVVKNNATIDWTIKESVRAKLKITVKRALRKFGYPPDLAKLATETVLQQAELLAKHWAK